MQNTHLHFQIKTCPLNIIVSLLEKVPEFDPPKGLEYYQNVVEGKKFLGLIAVSLQGEILGFKAGYERDGGWYSWLGAVFPPFRGIGVAKALALHQEEWARKQGYDFVFFKTRNRFKAMLIFALSNGFDIIRMEEREKIDEYRIFLKKPLGNSL